MTLLIRNNDSVNNYDETLTIASFSKILFLRNRLLTQQLLNAGLITVNGKTRTKI